MGNYKFKYLHQVGDHTWWLDHKITPEARGMFAAMTSRMPVGGLPARYEQVCKSIAKYMYVDTTCKEDGDPTTDEEYLAMFDARWEAGEHAFEAERRLTEYPLHPRVTEFFNQFVRDYGHSSVIELAGGNVVYADCLSWWTAFLLFDSPLVCGQENSTRAVTRKDWPVCREAYEVVEVENSFYKRKINPKLQAIHDLGMEIANAEIEWWKKEFQADCPTCDGLGKYFPPPIEDKIGVIHHYQGSPVFCQTCNGTGKKYPNHDKEPFRPALDRARWALPGTISTGVAFASHVRERSRAIQDAVAFNSGSPEALAVIRELQDAYNEAVPGIAQLGLKEAWYEAPEQARVPFHLDTIGTDFLDPDDDDRDVEIDRLGNIQLDVNLVPPRDRQRTYADPILNFIPMVTLIRCSVAVSRDWHRHRTMYPFALVLVRKVGGPFILDHHYEPKSELGLAKWEEYFQLCADTFDYFIQQGDMGKAMLCVPFGARIQMGAQCGLRDFLYVAELRYHTHGANFEYQDQAKQMLKQLREVLQKDVCDVLKVPEFEVES